MPENFSLSSNLFFSLCFLIFSNCEYKKLKITPHNEPNMYFYIKVNFQWCFHVFILHLTFRKEVFLKYISPKAESWFGVTKSNWTNMFVWGIQTANFVVSSYFYTLPLKSFFREIK